MDRDYSELSVEETLNRHRTILTEFCQNQKIPVEQILEEVVSGETLSARPQMLKLLELMNTGHYAGVVCMDIDRLSRGSGFETGYIMQVFQINGCKIITPTKTYDLANEQDEQFTDMQFLFSRYELKTITKRLIRGRHQSAAEGKYLGSVAPYGYDIVKIEGAKGNTLQPNEEAQIVQKIFQMYADGIGYNTIAYRLNQMHIPSRSGKWIQSTIFNIIGNDIYVGKIHWKKEPQKRVIENGSVKKVRYTNKDCESFDGLHPPIIPMELWDKCQKIRTNKSNPSLPIGRKMQNPFADLIICHKCGSRIRRNVPAKNQNTGAWYRCTGAGRICDCRVMKCDAVEAAVLDAVRVWFDQYTIQIDQKPTETVSDEKLIVEEITRLKTQQDRICDLLEQGVYTVEVYAKRNAAITEQIRDLEGQLSKKKKRDTSMVIPSAVKILDCYPELSVEEKNQLWKCVLDHIEIYRPKTGDAEVHIFPVVKI